jgi:hypothetical protein
VSAGGTACGGWPQSCTSRTAGSAIFDGLEAGDYEVLADDTSRRIKQNLSQPLTALYPQLANAK